jgi:hypothetical protein
MTISNVVVVDGSNIATEGRTMPSLVQLDQAVRAFLEDRPEATCIVVVDATFEHRIDPSEKTMYDEAQAANELITPPAGTIGRGDKFLLEIAERADATVFSNDSFQEFHGEYDWLFDTGRLIGGKPVPGVGWIFTPRNPVRGPKSRQATRAASRKRDRDTEATVEPAAASSSRRRSPRSSPAASLPMPVPTIPPPGPSPATVVVIPAAPPDRTLVETDNGSTPRVARRGAKPVNDGLPFIGFITEHPVGSVVSGEVVEFSSHGAYVQVGDARCYVPLKLMGDPPPRSARELLERGEQRDFVVHSFDGPRRGGRAGAGQEGGETEEGGRRRGGVGGPRCGGGGAGEEGGHPEAQGGCGCDHSAGSGIRSTPGREATGGPQAHSGHLGAAGGSR